VNKQILEKLKITQVQYENFLRKEELKDTIKVRKEFYRDFLDGRIVLNDEGELVRKKVRTK